MKRVLIDLEENGCTVKEAVDYLKGLGYKEYGYVIAYNASVIIGHSSGAIGWGCSTYLDQFFHEYEKLTIKEEPIVFSNPLMQHIGREVVANDGEGNFSGWVIGVYEHYGYILTVDIGVEIEDYTHGGLHGGVGFSKGTLRWFYHRNVKFVNEDGSLSDE